MLTFATLTFPLRLATTFSKRGSSALQGPHQLKIFIGYHTLTIECHYILTLRKNLRLLVPYCFQLFLKILCHLAP